jgi:hypothetical protein
MSFDREVFYIEEGKLSEAFELMQLDFQLDFDNLQQVALSEVHLVRARCPHHKSFIINICT